jgi:predicted branched-subunit amino acid permease
VCNAGGVTAAAPASRKARLRAGVRAGIRFGVAGALLSVSFGIVAQDAGMSQVAAIVMSAIVFAGSAQSQRSRSCRRAARSPPRSAPPR